MLDDNLLKNLSLKMVVEPDNFMSSFKKNLFTYINEKSITLSDIAEASGLSYDTVKSLVYTDSKDCKLSTAVALAKALKISVDELVGAGTFCEETRNSIRLSRVLPKSYVRFIRWTINYHDRMLRTNKVSEKAINVMQAEYTQEGNLLISNNFDLLDISDLSDALRPKIFMGIKIPSDSYMPIYSENDVLLIANDRSPLKTEHAVVSVRGYIWIVKRVEEKTECGKSVKYYSIRNSKFQSDAEGIEEVIGYVAAVHHEE